MTKDEIIELKLQNKEMNIRNRYIKYRNKRFDISYVKYSKICGLEKYHKGIYYLYINSDLNHTEKAIILHELIRGSFRKKKCLEATHIIATV